MATTSWPTLSWRESPSLAAGSVDGGIDADQRQIGIGIVAEQPRGQAPPVLGGDGIAPAPCTTWLLVRISPSGATTTPEPLPPREGPPGIGDRIRSRPRRARHLDMHHGGTHELDGADDRARIGIEDLGSSRRSCDGTGGRLAAVSVRFRLL